MKKVQRILLAAILIGALVYGWAHKELFFSLRNISASHVFALILLTFLSELQNGYKFRLLMKMFNVNLDFRAWYGLSVCNAMLNCYLPAKGGLAARAYYLKRRYQFGYSQYASLAAGSCIIAFPVSAGTGLAVVILYAVTGHVFYRTLAVVFGSLLLLTTLGVFVVLLLCNRGKMPQGGRFSQVIYRVMQGLSLFPANKRLVFWHSVLHITGILTWAARLLVAFSAVGIPVIFSDMVMTSSLGTFALLLPLTPASLGVSEGIVGASAHLYGIPADTAVLAALVDRAVATTITLLLGLVFSRILVSDLILAEGES